MSLSTRITLLVVALLTAAALLAAVGFHASVRRTFESEAHGLIAARMAWLHTALEVDPENQTIQLSTRGKPADAAEFWHVATSDGRILWQSVDQPAEPLAGGRGGFSRRVRLHFGEPSDPHTTGDQVVPRRSRSRDEASWDEVPEAVVETAHRVVRGITPQRITRRSRTDGEVRYRFYRIDGQAGGREYHLEIAETGGLLSRVDQGFITYRYAEEEPARIELELFAAVSAQTMQRELGRLAQAMGTVGPLALLLTAALLALAIRWQLRPLSLMAAETASIGPTSLARRIGARARPRWAGASRECRVLQQSINDMLQRLEDGFKRERNFAASAAHELRTPLAQMKTAVEIALRRQRTADEYRDALSEMLVDLERLQKLVTGLLLLARDPQAQRARSRTVPLEALLTSAAASSGPLRVDIPQLQRLAVQGDPELTPTAIRCVLENAGRYAPGEPPTATVELAQDRLHLIISDRGPGVPADDRQRIFEPLTRLDAARTVCGSEDGFGLGLAIARATMLAFDGDLACRGRSDGASGAEFVFTFRRASSPACPATKSAHRIQDKIEATQ